MILSFPNRSVLGIVAAGSLPEFYRFASPSKTFFVLEASIFDDLSEVAMNNRE
jgi:hypothetical protein